MNHRNLDIHTKEEVNSHSIILFDYTYGILLFFFSFCIYNIFQLLLFYHQISVGTVHFTIHNIFVINNSLLISVSIFFIVKYENYNSFIKTMTLFCIRFTKRLRYYFCICITSLYSWFHISWYLFFFLFILKAMLVLVTCTTMLKQYEKRQENWRRSTFNYIHWQKKNHYRNGCSQYRRTLLTNNLSSCT